MVWYMIILCSINVGIFEGNSTRKTLNWVSCKCSHSVIGSHIQMISYVWNHGTLPLGFRCQCQWPIISRKCQAMLGRSLPQLPIFIIGPMPGLWTMVHGLYHTEWWKVVNTPLWQVLHFSGWNLNRVLCHNQFKLNQVTSIQIVCLKCAVLI